MGRNNDRISSVQLAMILSVSIIGVGILSLPRSVAEAAGPDAWILVLMGTLMILIIALVISKIVTKFQQKTMIEFSEIIVGKPIGILITIGFSIYGIIFAAVEARLCAEVIKEYLLFNTPTEVIMVTLLLVSVYLVRSGIEPIARMAQIIFPIVTIIAILLIIPVLPEIDWTHFLPVLKTPILKLIKSLPVVILSFIGIELALVFSTFVIDTKNIKKNMYITVGLVAMVYFFIVSITIARFGIQETIHITWPTLELFKTVDIPGAFVENIEIFVIAIWILSVFMTLVSWYFSASLTISWVLKVKEQKYFVLPLIPIIYYLALLPDNLAQAMDYVDRFVNYFGIFYMIVLPIVLLGISAIRKGGRKGA
ncbi:endospore germination permease [Lutibacter sp. B2]|nr:endospore germination permease [Lutibacter sp. B2]